jgi:DNA-binding NtrC family response regulator/tetratricopeptide (TPR) repeat protein
MAVPAIEHQESGLLQLDTRLRTPFEIVRVECSAQAIPVIVAHCQRRLALSLDTPSRLRTRGVLVLSPAPLRSMLADISAMLGWPEALSLEATAEGFHALGLRLVVDAGALSAQDWSDLQSILHHAPIPAVLVGLKPMQALQGERFARLEQAFIVTDELGPAESELFFATVSSASRALQESAADSRRNVDLSKLTADGLPTPVLTSDTTRSIDEVATFLASVGGSLLRSDVPIELASSLDVAAQIGRIRRDIVAILVSDSTLRLVDAFRAVEGRAEVGLLSPRAVQWLHDSKQAWALARLAQAHLVHGDVVQAWQEQQRAFALATRIAHHYDLVATWVQSLGKADGARAKDSFDLVRIATLDYALVHGYAPLVADLLPPRPASRLDRWIAARYMQTRGDFAAANAICHQLRLELVSGGVTEDDALLAEVDSIRSEIAFSEGKTVFAVELALALTKKAPASTEVVFGQPSLSAAYLRARNILGKSLLAEARWQEANAHYSADELYACNAQLSKLRARLNRGIALLSLNQLEFAHEFFVGVLRDANRACAAEGALFAEKNLSVIAYREHRYGDCIVHLENAIALQPSLQNHHGLLAVAQTLTGLRLRFGLLDHARTSLAFLDRSLRQGCSLAQRADALYLRGALALATGDTTDAYRLAVEAFDLASSGASNDLLAPTAILAIRAALQDGDLKRVALHLEAVERVFQESHLHAELLYCRALYLRGQGDPACHELSVTALSRCHVSADEIVLIEALVLRAELCMERAETKQAEDLLLRAQRTYERLASTLPSVWRGALLATPAARGLETVRRALTHGPSRSAASNDTVSVLAKLGSTEERALVGDSAPMMALRGIIRRVAKSEMTVLVTGESGTGKELVAAELHRESERANKPLVSLNCAALVESLLLSELFGHEKGAFTGATARKLGRFEQAEGGTLFLDEIGDISPKTQVALLRVLQEKCFERVGGQTSIRANVRVVCATHRDLPAMVARGEFREDLYYRLRGFQIEVPALREHVSDLRSIAEHLLVRIGAERREQAKTLSDGALHVLSAHRWPGNIRELENVLRGASVFCDTNELRETDVLGLIRAVPAAPKSGVLVESEPPSSTSITDMRANALEAAYRCIRSGTLSLFDLKREVERDAIAKALAETQGNITRAAGLLGMKRPRLSQLVKQYGLAGGLDIPDEDESALEEGEGKVHHG